NIAAYRGGDANEKRRMDETGEPATAGRHACSGGGPPAARRGAMMPTIRGRSVRVLFSAEEIARRNAELAAGLDASGYRDLMVLSVLKGSFVFAADLVRALHGAGLSPEVDFMTLSSYGDGAVSSGRVSLLQDVERALAGRDILIVDDILETGRTLAF